MMPELPLLLSRKKALFVVCFLVICASAGYGAGEQPAPPVHQDTAQTASVYALTGYGYYLKGDLTQALNYYERALHLNPTGADAEKIRAEYLGILEQAKRWHQMKAFLESDLKKQKSPDSDTLLRLARVNLALNQPAQALSALAKLPRTRGQESKVAADVLRAQAYEKSGNERKAVQYARQILAVNKNDPEAQMLLARYYRNNRKTPEAVKLYENVLKQTPSDKQALISLAELYLEEKKTEEALILYQRYSAFDENENDPDLLLRIARLSTAVNRPDKAARAYEKILAQEPDNIEALFEVGMAAYHARQYEQAETLLTRFVRQVPASAEVIYALANIRKHQDGNQAAYRNSLEIALRHDPTNLAYLTELKEIYLADNQPELLLPVMKRVAELEPDNYEVVFNYAKLQYDLKQFSASAETFTKALAIATKKNLSPQSTENLLYRGKAYLNAHKKDAAFADFQKVLSMNPRPGKINEEANHLIGKLYFDKGDLNNAKKHLEAALAANSNLLEPSLILGKIYTGEENFASAEKYLANAVRLDPADIDVQEQVGLIYTKLDQPEKAAQAYRYVVEKNPDHLAALTNLGLAYLKSNENRRAIVTLHRAANLDPQNPERMNALGLAYLQAGLYPDAVAAFQRAVALAPDKISFHYNLGEAYQKNGERDRGLSEFEVALKGSAANADEYLNRGRVYFRLGLYQQAMDDYQQALSKYGDKLSKAQVYLAQGYLYEAQNKPGDAQQAYRSYLEIIPKGNTADKVRLKLEAAAK